FIALAIAIESLIDPKNWPHRTGATKRFKEFIRKLLPEAKEEDVAVLYKVRSDLAHGWSVLHYDETPWSRLTHHPRFLDEHNAIDAIWVTFRRILIAWLYGQAPSR